jgi:hypothetical protein
MIVTHLLPWTGQQDGASQHGRRRSSSEHSVWNLWQRNRLLRTQREISGSQGYENEGQPSGI